MTAARDKRVAAAFAGLTARHLRDRGFTVSPASSRTRVGLRVHTLASNRCRVSADIEDAREARDLIDSVVAALHKDHVRTWRNVDDSVTVFKHGIALDSHDARATS